MGTLELLEAENGVQGLEVATLNPVDLMIVDVNMPKMDGFTFVREVRERPALRAVPIILATSEGGPSDVAKAYALGVNFHLCKPIDAQVLQSAVRRLLGRTL
jgi:two-component system chemotaxis response regulator CheY